MDLDFLTGLGAFVAAVLIFCGSVWLLLTMVLGARLAYFISASVTLGFVLILAAVWSFTNPASPLGPVGELPSWEEVAIGTNVSEFGYPQGEWREPSEDNEEDANLVGSFEGDALDYLTQVIEEGGEGVEFSTPGDAVVAADATRLIEQDGDTYGATVFTPTEALEQAADAGADPAPEPVTVVMKHDEGNPLSKARGIFGGTLVLLILHMFGLSRSERKTRELPGAEVA